MRHAQDIYLHILNFICFFFVCFYAVHYYISFTEMFTKYISNLHFIKKYHTCEFCYYTRTKEILKLITKAFAFLSKNVKHLITLVKNDCNLIGC